MTGSTWLVVGAAVAVVNPPRLSPALHALGPLLVDSTSIRRSRVVAVVALGAGGVGCALALLALVSEWLLDATDVSPPTMRVAAGLVLILAVVRDLVGGRPAAEPALSGWGAALVPVAVPFVARPELAILVVSTATVEGFGPTIVALGAVMVTTVVVSALDRAGPAGRVTEWLGWALTTACLAAGVALTVDGVYGV